MVIQGASKQKSNEPFNWSQLIGCHSLLMENGAVKHYY
jgi:hypothetical protein